MTKFDIVFYLPTSDNEDYLKVLVENVLKNNKNCSIIIHVDSKKGNYKKIDNENVFYTKERIKSVKYKIMTPLVVINKEHRRMNIECMYICLLASNNFFFQENSIDYMKKFDYGCYNFSKTSDFIGKWRDCYNFSKTLHKEDITYSGQFEGTFYKKELFDLMVDRILSFCPLKKMNSLQDTTEECFLPTAANILLKEYKRGLPICLIKARLDGYDSDLYSYDYDTVVSLIQKLRDKDYKIKYVLEEKEDNHFFCYKRVQRNLNDRLLKYLSD